VERRLLPSGDRHRADMEELDVRHLPAVQLLNDGAGIRPLDLIAVVAAANRLVAGAGRRPVVPGAFDVAPTRLAVELHPVDRGLATHEVEPLLRSEEHTSE